MRDCVLRKNVPIGNDKIKGLSEVILFFLLITCPRTTQSSFTAPSGRTCNQLDKTKTFLMRRMEFLLFACFFNLAQLLLK